MKGQISFYLCLLIGFFVLTIDSRFLAYFGLGNYGRVIVFLFVLMIGFALNFGAFRKAAKAMAKPGEAAKEVMEYLEKDSKKD